MRPVLLAVLIPLALAACAAPPSAVSADGVRRVAFDCANGEAVEMRFFPQQGVAVLVRDGKTRELQQAPSGSGFRYVGSGVEVRGKGDELTIETVSAAIVQCRARG